MWAATVGGSAVDREALAWAARARLGMIDAFI
jgi:hypothetical protein